MRYALAVLAIVAVTAVPAAAQKVNIDYAHDYDFDSISTFKYVDTEESNVDNSLMHDRISSLIKSELVEGGLKEVQDSPDVFVTYHFTTEDNTVFHTTNYGYGGYWGGWGGWGRYGGVGMGTSTTSASTYTEGTLIIDAYDSGEKKMIWRGMGTVTVKSKPEKQVKQVENILGKIGNKWDKILAGQGK